MAVLENLKPRDSFGSIFDSTDPAGQGDGVRQIAISKLNHYENHPFALYEGERFDTMLESVKINGVIVPLIVRPARGDEYEILAGHNRCEAAKLVGLKTVPCVVKEGLTDAEAYVYVTETNLVQRSFADLSPSERAAALAAHYEAIKSQGKRSDLVKEINELTSGQVVQKLDSRESVGEHVGISGKNVSRYIRINGLEGNLKKRMDMDLIPVNAAFQLAFLTDSQQQFLVNQMFRLEAFHGVTLKVSINQAEQLRSLAEADWFTVDTIEPVFFPKKPEKKRTIKLDWSDIESYFDDVDSDEDVVTIVLLAVREYFKNSEE